MNLWAFNRYRCRHSRRKQIYGFWFSLTLPWLSISRWCPNLIFCFCSFLSETFVSFTQSLLFCLGHSVTLAQFFSLRISLLLVSCSKPLPLTHSFIVSVQRMLVLWHWSYSARYSANSTAVLCATQSNLFKLRNRVKNVNQGNSNALKGVDWLRRPQLRRL